MKKRLVMAVLAMSMTLGACGTTGNQPAAPEVPVNTTEPTQAETPTGAPASEAPAPVKVEEPLPEVSSNAQNLTEGLGTIQAPDAGINAEQTEALSKASLQLFAEAVKREGEHPNVLLSPTSIQIAFGMTENGAKGGTLAQMEQVIGGGIVIDEMNPLLYSLSDRLRSSQEAEWNVANSIWFKNDGHWRVKDDFAQKALSWYGADIWEAPFDDSTVTDINNWVAKETKGMIPGIIDQIPEDARMYLVNAMAFEGEWLSEYTDNEIFENCEFTNADGSTSNVTMLWSNEDSYFTLGDGTGFVRDYKGGEYSFMGLLPVEGTDLDSYIASLAAEDVDLAAAIKNSEYGNVIVEIPEFTDDYDIEMSEMLKDMGMDLPFDMAAADFTDMMEPVDVDGNQIWLGRVLHKTHIEVDRVGTRAAAVTAIEVEAEDSCEEYEEPVMIILDRPFIYGIIDNETGLPVFLGCVNTL